MRAARYYDRKDIRIEDVEAPELKPGHVAIDVAWCGICGTDLHEYLEGPIFIPPAGHLCGLRRVHLAVRAQLERRWATELGGLQPEYDPHAVTTLRGARVLIWGYGNIARELTGHLQALGATVTGAARSARTENGVSVVGAEGLEDELKRTDVLVMILPGSDSTHHALNAARLALLPARSWVVNVGRGTAIDQQALLEAVRGGKLAGAALDVTDPEPLPSDSPLWDEPGIIITPHAAGGRPLDAAPLIEANVRAYLAGEPLRNVLQAGSPA